MMSRMIGRSLSPAEAAQAMLHVGEEALARLLAVVADVDAGCELAFDHVAGGRLGGPRQGIGVVRLATALPDEQLEQAGGRGRLPAWVVRIRRRLRSIRTP